MANLVLGPQRGTMSAKVFQNPHLRIPPSLFFKIEIPLNPFQFQGETQVTSVRLDFIDFGVFDWKELPNREFRFPKNPEDGYIDGSMYLGGTHNPADCTRIRFGNLEQKTLPTSLDIEFDFTYEGPIELGKVAVTWQVDLDVDSAGLDRVIEESRRVIKKRRR
ncbi:MAG: hypothetical protein K2X38_03305 [Gemmataceae bacterium]|nr:hypothetical protein [Gemmataceae bacterium]